jgi:undecaprenyl-diphosphatase
MSYLETLFLGLVQGIAEFLPISSDGHLAIAQALLGRKLDSLATTLVLHVGTLLSILVVFWRDLLALRRQPRLCAAILVATLPLIPVGLFLKDFVEAVFEETIWAGVGLCATAAVLAAYPRAEHGDRSLEDIRLRDALLIGAFQALAPLPGVSRSGTTIFGGLLSGLSRTAAARFSFLIAIPAIGGATLLYGKKYLEESGVGLFTGPLLAGAVVSFVVGIVALRWLLRLVQTRQIWPFALYCLAVGLTTIAWQLSSK